MDEFERLLRAHYGPLERFIKFQLSGNGDAEDMLQEVCLTAYQKYHTLRDSEKFKPWILQIARNKCRNYFLAKAPEQYTVGMILRVTEGSLAPVACLEEGAEACERCDTCETVEVWKELAKAIDNVVDNVTIADLVNRRKKRLEALDYSI